MLALGSFDSSTGQNTTVLRDAFKEAGLNGAQNRANPGRWWQSHKRPLPSTGNFLSAEVLTDVYFTDESGATKKLSYIKIKADERGLAIIRSLTPLPTSNELNRSPENTLTSYHWFHSRAPQWPPLSGAMGVAQHCILTPIATVLMDLLFYQTVQNVARYSTQIAVFCEKSRVARWRTQIGQVGPNTAQNPEKRVPIAEKKTRETTR